ncbi:MAG: heme-binding protein [Gammaproteobacteria bacterium]
MLIQKSLAALLLVFGLLLPSAAAAIETPDFDVVDTLGETIEVRCYPAMQLATTVVEGSQDSVGNKAFRRLAGYIFGDNQAQQKIAKTTPFNQSLMR